MIQFNHIQHTFQALNQITNESNRLYVTPNGNKYPSVTTVTGLRSAASIAKWRKRIGEAEADKISARASSRGTTIHSLCEDYLNNKEVMPNDFNKETFNSIKGYLNRINNIHCLETRLYSDHLYVAGTVDCIAEFDGKLSIIDFKTSKKEKSRDQITNYFAQTAAYAVMFEELTKIPVTNLVIIMSVDDLNEGLLFKEKRDDWINTFIEMRNEYYELKGI